MGLAYRQSYIRMMIKSGGLIAGPFDQPDTRKEEDSAKDAVDEDLFDVFCAAGGIDDLYRSHNEA